MSFLGRFFNNKDRGKSPAVIPLNIPFGRYSDAYKPENRLQHWERAAEAYDAEKYISALEHLLEYLKNEKGNNIHHWMDNGVMRFEIIQGSKKILGIVDRQQIEVEAKIAQTNGLKMDFMRRLMERNYELKYGRFALDTNDDIAMRFDTDLLDASPYKLYNALKEVAINSDKLDDLLIDEYEELTPINIQHIEASSEQEQNAKLQFVQQWILATLKRTNELNEAQLTAGVAYLLLDLTYRLDYLIKPEGYLMEMLERAHRQYFARDGQSLEQKCNALIEEYKNLLTRSEDSLKEEFYHTIATFGITMPVNHHRLVSFIDGELSNMDWYLRNGYPDVALAISGYVVGYCMFEFAVPKPDRELLHLYYEVTQGAYFSELDHRKPLYKLAKNKFDKTIIRQRIHQIAKNNQRQYPFLQPDTSLLDFTNLEQFGQSFLLMVRQLDLSNDY